jgi:diguanylate cyclase (GGDEF)-like protein/putative nucleotidyltransferase with HDIG domain
MRGGPRRTRATAARIKRLLAAAPVDPEEVTLAGTVSGVLYVMGGLTLASFMLLPGVAHNHSRTLLIIAGGACAWGLASIALIPWKSASAWLIHLSSTAGLGVVAAAVASSGGAASPAWIYLFFIAVFAAYFYRRPVALAYLLGCVAVHALPLLYDARATSDAFMAQYVIAGPAYLVFGAAILAGKARIWTLRSRAEQLAAEQSALRRVATAVVGGEPTERVYELVAFELAHIIGAGAAGILRLTNAGQATVLGSWADHRGGSYEPGTIVPVRPGSDVERALATRRPVRIDAHAPGSPVHQLGYRSSIVAPIQVGGAVWGALAVAAKQAQLTAEDEQRLTTFGDLLASAIASIEDRAKLAAQASTDPLTGLANHRTLQQRIAAEVARAVRHGHPLSVAVIDIDHFKQINDVGGHEAGDAMLVAVAECLSGLARAEDTLGRAGGDEFAWVLPECTRTQALTAVERARRQIAVSAPRPYRMTVSAGICDTSVTTDPAELIKLADGALYWSKAHGRDQCWIYDPEVVNELSAQERAERLQRSQALLGLRALARAIDAKDPATREHSERVAAMATALARTAGWSPERTLLLSEAALVHDVGKIGVPDELLRKAEPLTEAERAQIETHAELAARIVEDVLAPEQVEWIRTHHERPDGAGYPRRLRAEQIPEGAALLAVADAWDVMTVSRPYSVPKTPREALAECVRLVGRQFTKAAVDALIEVHRDDRDAEASLVMAVESERRVRRTGHR